MAKKEDNAQLLQQKYMEMQMIEQQLRQIQQQVTAVDQQSMEIEFIVDSLENLSKVDVGTEVLVPMSSGIFVKAKLQDNKELIVNVGSNTTVNKKIPEVQNMLKEQVKEMNRAKKELSDKFAELAAKMQQLQADLMSQGE